MNRRMIICAALMAAGTAFVIIGISRGEMVTVMMKGARICLECIGIG